MQDLGAVHSDAGHEQVDLVDQLVNVLVLRFYVFDIAFVDGLRGADIVQLAPGHAHDGVAFGVVAGNAGAFVFWRQLDGDGDALDPDDLASGPGAGRDVGIDPVDPHTGEVQQYLAAHDGAVLLPIPDRDPPDGAVAFDAIRNRVIEGDRAHPFGIHDAVDADAFGPVELLIVE